MEHRRISMNDIVIGEPLAWDVYDLRNHLLLRKGHVVERPQQIEALIERGLFIDKHHAAQKDEPAPEKLREIPSVLRLRNAAVKQLERLLLGLPNETEVQPKIEEVARVLEYAVGLNPDIALACILLSQDVGSYSVRHSVDTGVVSCLAAKSMRKTPEQISSIVCAALTMNAGMLRYQEHFQSKGEALTDKEKLLIRSHPEESVEMLKRAGVHNEDWLSCVLLHHENEDGSGYPFGKPGADTPENAKIVAIADRYCARVSARNYRKSLLPNAALRDILLADKKNIDPMLAANFIKELGVYPTGTFVRMQNGEIGVVTGKGATTTTPFVHALIGPRGAPLSFPIKRDTSKDLHTIREVLHESQAAIRFTMQQLWGAEAAL